MKKVFYVLVILIYSLSGCKDNKVTNPIIEGSGSISSIEGKLVDWKLAGSYHLNLQYRDLTSVWSITSQTCSSAKIDTNGSFKLTNFINVVDSLLIPSRSYEYDSTIKILENTVTDSDPSAKGTIGFINIIDDTTKMAVAGVYRLNFVHTSFNLRTFITSPGEFITNLIYRNKDQVITGKFKYERSDVHTLSTTTQNYNLNYKKGWNKAVTLLVSRTIENDGTRIIIKEEFSYSNIEPGPADWYYFMY